MDWSVQQIAKLAGTTGRTLRHYDDIGLLQYSCTRQQRLPVLRPGIPGLVCSGSCSCADLGLGLPAIADVLVQRGGRGGMHLAPHLCVALAGTGQGWGRQIAAVSSHHEGIANGRGKESWRRKCSTVSTTPSTRRKSSSGGARTPMQNPRRLVAQLWGGRGVRLPGRNSPRQPVAEWNKAGGASGVPGGQRAGAGPGPAPRRMAQGNPRHTGVTRSGRQLGGTWRHQGDVDGLGRDVRGRSQVRRQLRRCRRRRPSSGTALKAYANRNL